MKLWLEINGALLVVLALLHGVFPRYFRWKDELRSASLLTRQILHVHTFFIALTVGLMGLLCLTSAAELLTTKLGRTLCAGLFVFWFCRLFIQFFGYSPELWRGKRFETIVHIAFSFLWLDLTTCFACAIGFPLALSPS
ncbi:MAG: hypothetical protein RIQ79_2637 [Verrucomicrobiota bacterium]